MPISAQCTNGHAFKVKDELAGKKVKCPKCSVVVELPGVNTKAQRMPTAEIIEAELVEICLTPEDDVRKPISPKSAQALPELRSSQNFTSGANVQVPSREPAPSDATEAQAYSLTGRDVLLYGCTSAAIGFILVIVLGWSWINAAPTSLKTDSHVHPSASASRSAS